jgi:hypothetical protein
VQVQEHIRKGYQWDIPLEAPFDGYCLCFKNILSVHGISSFAAVLEAARSCLFRPKCCRQNDRTNGSVI